MKKSIKILLPFLFTVLAIQAYAQTDPVFSPVLSPRIEWKSITWAPYENDWQTPLDRNESGEDWMMDVIDIYEDGVHIGYAACGFSSWTDWEEYNEYAPCALYSRVDYINALDFITDEYPKGIQRQTVVILDLKGQMVEMFRYNIGDTFKIFQDENDDLIVTGSAYNPVPFNEPHMVNVPMYVHPELGGNFVTYDLSNFPANFCDGNGDVNKGTDFNVFKIDLEGNVLYNNVYNNKSNLIASFESSGHGTGIVSADDNNIYVVGNTILVDDQDESSRYPYILKLNEDGEVIWDFQRAIPDGVYFWIDRKDDHIVLTGHYYPVYPGPLVAFMEFIDLESFTEEIDAFESPDWEEHTTDGSIYETQFGFDDALNHSSRGICFSHAGDIIWPVMANNSHPFYSGNNVCEGKIFIFDDSGSMINTNNEPIELGEMRAFDLYLSPTPTDDGGFAIVSSRHSPEYFGTSNLPSYSDPDIGPCLVQINADIDGFNENWAALGSGYYGYWSTCSYIAKFDASYEFEWDKIWDSTDNAPRECPPGNLKQQECVYRIIQAPDGGLVICGNTSDNIDDNYIVKLYSDCGILDFIGVTNSEGEITDPNLVTNLLDGIVEIGENTVWNTDKKVLGKVRVLDGYTLTIDGITVDFAGHSTESGGIQIEPNALLEIDGATLTHLEPDGEECPATWNGIEVWGTTDQPQNPVGGYYHQGRLIADNSTIEHAYNAITNWKWQDWDARGGIVKVSNTTFINTRRAAEFMRYQNFAPNGTTLISDQSYFEDCQFVLDNDYEPGPERTHPLVTLWGVHGVKFEGCEFVNGMTNVEHSQQLTAGIASNSAYYLVSAYCPDPATPLGGPPCSVPLTNSSFTGFHHGVLATVGNSGVKPVRVTKSIFNDNMTGIELRETDFSIIRQNEIYVGEHLFEPDPQTQRNTGVFSFGTSAYSIEENHFEKVGSNGWDTHGAVIQSSGAAENELYKNDLEGLMYGSVAIDNNRGGKLGNEGLQFLCNDNVHNGRDFDVVDLNDEMGKGIRSSQGDYPGVAAANTFSQSSAYSLDFMHFAQDQDMPLVGYAWYTGDLVQEPSDTEVTSNVDLGYSTSTERTCPSNFGGKHVADFKSAFDSASTEYYNLLYNYHQLTDGGDTEGLLDEIAGTWPQEAWDLRNSLLEDSPFLTVQVLIAAADRDVMPHAMLMEVLLANPDALRSNQLIDHLQYYMPNPLPQYMIDILLDARSEITVKTNLLGAMGQKSRTMAVNHKMVIQEMLSDTLGVDPDSLLTFMARLENISNHYALAMTHLEMGDPADGQTVLTNMRVIWDRMNTEEETEWEQFNDLYALFRTVQADGRNEARLTDAEIQDLLAIAHTLSGGRASGRAWNTLCFHYGICPEGHLPPAPRSFEAYESNNALSNATYNPVEAYPNPADAYTTLRYELFRTHPQTIIRIFDVGGRVVQSFNIGDTYEGQLMWDTRDAKPGMYVFQLWQNEEKVHAGKIVVNH